VEALSGPSPVELMIIFHCFICDFPNLEGQILVFYIPQEQGGRVISRAMGSLFVASYGSQWRYSNPPLHGKETTRYTSALFGSQVTKLLLNYRFHCKNTVHGAVLTAHCEHYLSRHIHTTRAARYSGNLTYQRNMKLKLLCDSFKQI
jgi:hypothetical protein